MPKTIEFIVDQVRGALNQQRDFLPANELSDAVYQASNQVFGSYAGHPALYRPGQPLAPRAYGLTERVDQVLRPFLLSQAYARIPTAGQLPLSAEGLLLFPVSAVLAGSFQYPTALFIDGARRVREINENALQAAQANSLTAATAQQPSCCAEPGGWRIRPASISAARLQYLAAPPRCVYAEKPDPLDPFNRIYDEAASVDVGWLDVTAINEIIACATRILGGQVKDAQAVGLATQTTQMGA